MAAKFTVPYQPQIRQPSCLKAFKQYAQYGLSATMQTEEMMKITEFIDVNIRKLSKNGIPNVAGREHLTKQLHLVLL